MQIFLVKTCPKLRWIILYSCSRKSSPNTFALRPFKKLPSILKPSYSVPHPFICDVKAAETSTASCNFAYTS